MGLNENEWAGKSEITYKELERSRDIVESSSYIVSLESWETQESAEDKKVEFDSILK